MSKIEEIRTKIKVSKANENRSIEDLLMDVMGCLVDANRANDKKADISEFIRVKDLFINSYPKLNYFDKDIFQLDYNFLIKSTLEDHLACAVIKLLGIAKIKDVDLYDDVKEYPDIFEKKNISESIFYIQHISFMLYKQLDMCLPTTLNLILNLAIINNIDLWQHVELRLKYNQVK